MPYNPRTNRPRKRSYHPEAVAWRTAALANGGTGITPSVMSAVSAFCRAIDAAGIRSKFLRLNLICGGNLAAARTPLYRGASASGTQYGGTIDANIGPYVSANYSEATGLAGDYYKVLDTGLDLPTAYTFGCQYNDVHLAVYNRDYGELFLFGYMDWGGWADDCGLVIDASYGGGVLSTTLSNMPCNTMVAGAGSTGTANHFVEANKNSRGYGFHLAEFPSSNTGVYTRNGTDITYGTTTGSLVSFQNATNYPTPLVAGGFAQTNVSDPDYTPFTDYYGASATIAAYSVGKSLGSSAARSAYNTAMAAFQTALGRAITTNHP
jgi:hypothetical protein